MTLSDKRNELYEDLLKQFEGVEHLERILFVTLNCVDDQDKELAKKLKDKFYKTKTFYKDAEGELLHCIFMDTIVSEIDEAFALQDSDEVRT